MKLNIHSHETCKCLGVMFSCHLDGHVINVSFVYGAPSTTGHRIFWQSARKFIVNDQDIGLSFKPVDRWSLNERISRSFSNNSRIFRYQFRLFHWKDPDEMLLISIHKSSSYVDYFSITFSWRLQDYMISNSCYQVD